MFERLKKIIASPYALPLTHPVKAVGRWAHAPIKDFISSVKYGLSSGQDKGLFSLRVIKAVTIDSYPDTHTRFIGWIGAIVGGAGAVIGAAMGAHALGLGWIGMTAAAISATSAGLMIGPFIAAGVVAAGAAVVGAAVTGIPSFIEGFFLAHKQAKALKAQAATVAAVPQLAPAAPDVTSQATEMLAKLRAMPAEAQAPLLRELNAQYRGNASLADTDSIVKAIVALPENDRVTFARSIQTTLKDAFDTVARQEADSAMALHTSVKAGAPLKLKTTSQP